MRVKISLLLLFFGFSNLISLAQSTDVQRVIGPSPNVASLFKFIDEPVSLYSGTPNIEVPIYTLATGKIKVPITLMYHAGGIKVTEEASWVGLGWALDAGGAVASVVNGLSDVDNGNRIMKDNPTDCELTKILNGLGDSEKDLFYFSFPGGSGEFYLNDSMLPMQIPYTKIRIQGPAGGWVITNTDGLSYYYTLKETTVSSRLTVNRGVGNPNIGGASVGNNGNYDVSAESWFLTKITDPTGDSVIFNYQVYSAVDQYFRGETNYYQNGTLACGGGDPTEYAPTAISSYEYQRINGWRLQSIVSRTGTIQFLTGGSRCDLMGDSYLSEIDVDDPAGTPVKKFQFKMSYLTGTTFTDVSSVNCSSEGKPNATTVDLTLPCLQRRMMLMELDEDNVSTGAVDNRYKFGYNTTYGLPFKMSSEQDTWGFYNKNGQTSLLQNLSTTTANEAGISVPTINGRSANGVFAQQGMLTSISYPTGGTTSFVYESDSLRNFGGTCGALTPMPAFNATGAATSNGALLGTFTVNQCPSGDSVLVQISGCHFSTGMGAGTTLPYGFYIENGSTIVKSSNDIISASGGDPVDGVKIWLPNGTYSVYTFSSSGPSCSYTVTIPARMETPYVPPAIEVAVGGLRVKQIVHQDPVAGSSITQNYSYNNVEDSITASSGILPYGNYLPWTNNYLTARDLSCGGGLNQAPVTPLLVLNSNTNYPLTMTHGSFIGYSQVTETRTDGSGNNIGQTVYTYTNPSDVSFQSVYVRGDSVVTDANLDGDFFPFAPNYSNEWQRGKLLTKEDYKNNGDGSFSIVQRTKNYYSAPIIKDTTHSLAVGYYLNSQLTTLITCSNGTDTYNGFSTFKYTPYRLFSEYQNLDSTTIQTYDVSANVVYKATYYQYDTSNLQPSVIKTTNSKNEYIINVLTYPGDYQVGASPTDTRATAIRTLKQANALNAVIESTISRSNTDNSNLRTVSSIFTSYYPNLPESDTVFSTEAPGLLSGFSAASIGASSTMIDSRYNPRVIFDIYDSVGNMLQQHKVSDVTHSYIWDYSASYPIAEVVNAQQSSIAYTSFEADGGGNWSIPDTTRHRGSALTGNNSYKLTGSNAITRSSLSSGTTYIVSYWDSTGSAATVNGVAGTVKATLGNWSCYEVQVTGATTITVGGTGVIDELRLYPKGALMTTYTYAPLIGLTSQCDASGKITYYSYDGLGRLKLVKDQYGNIVKRYDYEYQTSNY